jgi:hypothetical protein
LSIPAQANPNTAGTRSVQSGCSERPKGNSDRKNGLQDFAKDNSSRKNGSQDFAKGNSIRKNGLQDFAKGNSIRKSGLQDFAKGNSNWKNGSQDFAKGNSNWKNGLSRCSKDNFNWKNDLSRCSKDNSNWKNSLSRCSRGNSNWKNDLSRCSKDNSDRKSGCGERPKDYEKYHLFVTAQTLTGFETLLGLLAIAMPRLVDCCMGVTLTHPLPPLKRGRAERRSAVFRNTGSHFIILNFQFSILHSPVRVTRDCDAPPRGLLHGRYLNTPYPLSKRGGLSGEAQFSEIPAVISSFLNLIWLCLYMLTVTLQSLATFLLLLKMAVIM